MTNTLLAILLLALAVATHADPPADKTKRMVQIETRFNVRIVGILRTKDRDYWVFLEAAPELATLKAFPVVIPENGTDHDMTIARVAAENVAAYFEVEMKQPKPTPTPTSIFTLPVKPHREETHAK